MILCASRPQWRGRGYVAEDLSRAAAVSAVAARRRRGAHDCRTMHSCFTVCRFIPVLNLRFLVPPPTDRVVGGRETFRIRSGPSPPATWVRSFRAITSMPTRQPDRVRLTGNFWLLCFGLRHGEGEVRRVGFAPCSPLLPASLRISRNPWPLPLSPPWAPPVSRDGVPWQFRHSSLSTGIYRLFVFRPGDCLPRTFRCR